MNKRAVLLLFFCLAISFIAFNVTAAGQSEIITDTKFFAKQGEVLDIYDTCTFQGASCDATYGCNFTISYPNQTTLISQAATTKTGDKYNYTLTTNQTQALGLYEVNSYCSNGTNNGQLTFYYEINRSGNNPTTFQGVLYIVLFAVFLFLLVLCINAFANTPWEDGTKLNGNAVTVNYQRYFKFVYGFFSYLILMFIMFIGRGITDNFLFLDTAAAFFRAVSTIMVSAIGPVFLVSAFFVAFEIIKDKRNAKALNRDMPFDLYAE